jgi:hypothetical protein
MRKLSINVSEAPRVLARIEFMQSSNALLTEADNRLLDCLQHRLRKGELEVLKAELDRLEAIFEKDRTQNVRRVQSRDASFARGLFIPRPLEVGVTDPFLDLPPTMKSAPRPKTKSPSRRRRLAKERRKSDQGTR